jgi:transcriptional regulator with XRE-family HTH domain
MHETAFPTRLRALRTARGQSQTALSADIGFAQTTISQWEAGEYEPALLALTKLSEHFNCTTDFLCGRTDQPEQLPEGKWLIDQQLYDRVNAGEVGAVDADTSFGCPIPAGARIVDSGTYHRMLRELRAALAAPKRKNPR